MAGNLTAMIASIFSGGVSTDPYFNYTTLLLSTTATNGQQNNTFQDSSTNNFTITRNPATGPNAPTQGTFSPFSQTGWGNYFNGGANYLNVAAASSIDLASSNFTIECWAFPGTQTNAVDSVFGYGGFTTMLYRNGTTWSWEVGNGTSSNYFTITATCTPNTWQHIALTRSGNTFTFWINGVSAGTNSTANAVGTASKNLTIGYNNNPPNAQYFTGYISNFRIVKGTAVYTSAFTPPTSPLTDITNTSLLTCQSNRFIDTNTQLTAKTITVTGSPSVVPFSPFLPTSAWSASTVGGSGYFVYASANYLSTTVTVSDFYTALGDFTFEGWVYPLSFLGPQYSCPLFGFTNDDLMLRAMPTSATSTTLNIYGINSAGGAAFGSAGTSGGTIRLNEWAWVVFTRQSGVLNLWVNGARVVNDSTYTSTQLRQTATSLRIGGATAGTNPYWNGYLSGIKWTSGAALYSGATISMPTAPPTTTVSSGTNRLLLNFTNSGIYDATAKNVLETVGDAQASTTITKWSPTSMKFDGTGDYAVTPASPLNAFLTGDFTCEFWVYFNALATNQTVMGTASGFQTGGYQWIQLASNTLTFRMELTSGAINVATGALSTGQWYHIAAARSGTTVRVFVNGVLANSTTTGGSISDSTGNKVIVGNTVELQATRFFNGYLQDVRVTRGYARYTANFTPPTAAFPVQ